MQSGLFFVLRLMTQTIRLEIHVCLCSSFCLLHLHHHQTWIEVVIMWSVTFEWNIKKANYLIFATWLSQKLKKNFPEKNRTNQKNLKVPGDVDIPMMCFVENSPQHPLPQKTYLILQGKTIDREIYYTKVRSQRRFHLLFPVLSHKEPFVPHSSVLVQSSVRAYYLDN